MPSFTLRHTTLQRTGRPNRVDKCARNSPAKPSRPLRSSQKYFWYTSLIGLDQLALSRSDPARLPVVQTNAYIFSPTKFTRDQTPFALPTASYWPPKSARDLLLSTDPEDDECIGATCFNNTPCNSSPCDHTLKHWQAEAAQWQNYLDLRETKDRGLGIYTKSSFEKGDVLGWYAGEIVSSDADLETDYVMQMPISTPPSPPLSPCMSNISSYSDDGNEQLRSPPRTRSHSPATNGMAEPSVWIDASQRGNWTRFLNHSCSPHAEFRLCRIGDIRVMAVVVLRNVPKDVELTVAYGPDYYGRDTLRICYCGAARCVGKARHRK